MRNTLIAAALATVIAGFATGPASAGSTKLIGTVGPDDTISLSVGSHRATSLKAGAYTIVVNDRAGDHNFHFTGPGVDKTTSVAGTGKVTWHVMLKKGSYRYVCDPHAGFMKGTVKVS